MTFVILYGLYSCILYVFQKWMLNAFPKCEDGLVDWLILFSLIVPIVGLLASVLVFRYASRVDPTDSLDYEKMLQFDVLPYDQWLNDAKHSTFVMPIGLSIESERQDVSRELIIRHLNILGAGQGTYLKKAVSEAGKRSELAHYAATTFRLLNDRYLKRINQLENQPVTDTKYFFTSLYQAYHDYWRSQMLSGSEQNRLLLKQKALLEDIMEKFSEDPKYFLCYGEALTELNKNDSHIISHYQSAITRFPDNLPFQEKLIEALLYQDKWIEASQLLNNLEKQGLMDRTSSKFQEVIHIL